MKKLLALAFCGTFTAAAVAQTIPLYEHFGSAVYRIDKVNQAPPNIDATAFANYGTFIITNVIDYNLYPLGSFLELPYEPGNLVNFTNKNRMSGLFGFRFNKATDSGRRRMGTFFNDNGAVVDSVGGVIGENPTGSGQYFDTNILYLANSYLLVNATNIINRGTLRTDNRGIIRLEGEKVDLTRGVINVRPSQNIYDDYLQGCYDGGTKTWFGTNYIPDIGISDFYWLLDPRTATGYQEFQRFQPGLVYFDYFDTYVSVSGIYDIMGLEPPYFRERTDMVLFSPISFVYTNDVRGGGTNITIQAVFVTNTDTNIYVSAKFGPSTHETIDFPWANPCVEFSALQPNPLTGGVMTNRLYVMDYMMGQAEYNALQYNILSYNVPTYCPGNYVVSRTAPCEFLFGGEGNAFAYPELFDNFGMSNHVVTNFQTAYSFRITNIAVTVPANQSITNLGSRIEIIADELKMDRTRISSEGFVSVTAKHLVSSTNASLQVEYLNLDLGSTNGNLVVDNVLDDSVSRFSGHVMAYSSSWTNFNGLLVTNIITDPDTGAQTNEIVTNVVTLSYHILMLDSRLETRYPINILSLRTRATNTTIGDTLVVSDSLLVDAERLTVSNTGSLTIRHPINDWTTTNFPNLKYFTNLGRVVVTNIAKLGSDAPAPYASVVNRGSIRAAGIGISSDYLENSGLLSSIQVSTNFLGSFTNFGPMTIEASNAKLDTGTIECGLDLNLRAGDLKFRNHTTFVGGTLFLAATNTLSDSGLAAANTIQVGNGFHLQRRPSGGDLLGTTIRSTAASLNYVTHIWGAADMGAVKEGFLDNAAIGRLIVDGGLESGLTFAGSEAGSAMYVDFLQFTGTALQLEETVSISPNLTIYFADSNIPAEQLNGRLGGRIKWVSEFAGPNSSVDVVVSGGRTVRMNRALRNSPAFDSDSDGIANAFDPDPLTPTGTLRLSAITLTNVPPLKPMLAWDSLPLSVTHVESSSTLRPGSWQTLHKHTNDTLNIIPVKFVDPNPSDAVRYYRLRMTQ